MTTNNITVLQLAQNINTTRENMHKILNKQYIDVELLLRISKALNHDFFKDLSEEYKYKLKKL